MEGKAAWVSALGVGLGVGLGLGLNRIANGAAVLPAVELGDCFEEELYRLLLDGKDSKVTFSDFPFYVSEQTKVILTSAAFIHFNENVVSKHARNLSPASRAILLSGPTEAYLQMLSKALAHYFEAKLLHLDVAEFFAKMTCKYKGHAHVQSLRGFSETSLNHIAGFFGNLCLAPPWEHSNFEDTGMLRRYYSDIETQSNAHGDTDQIHHLRRNSEPALSKLASTPDSEISGSPTRKSNSAKDEKLLVQSIFKVLMMSSRKCPIILYLKDAEMLMLRMPRAYGMLHKMVTKLRGPVLVLGSRIVDPSQKSDIINERLSLLFPYNIKIKAPQDEANLPRWNSQFLNDLEAMQINDNRTHISEVLADNDLECDDLDSICFSDYDISSSRIEEIIFAAISHHVMNNKNPQYRNEKLVISSESLVHGLKNFELKKKACNDAGTGDVENSSKDPKQPGSVEDLRRGTESPGNKSDVKAVLRKESTELPKNATVTERVTDAKITSAEEFPEKKTSDPKSENNEISKKDSDISNKDNLSKREADAVLKKGTDSPKENDLPKKETPTVPSTKSEVEPDNEFEKRIRPEVIPAGEIGVRFSDIGALDNVKEALQELVMLPLRRPEFFKRGLLKPCKGILLFGPPGTGKTMIAKAVATEAGASFINVSMSTITSKWFGEDEKSVRALFSLAVKVAPTVIFIDEVDSMLGQRTRVGEHEAMRKIKNEFMTHWDGLLSKNAERVLVLAATNRPFDLDEAIIRRFERRIMVGLPTTESRENILRTLLAKESLEDGFDYKELATITEGFTGSDLKNLCTTAAFQPLRELLRREHEQQMARKKASESKASENMVTLENNADQNKDTGFEPVTLRPLSMADMKKAKDQISASFASEGSVMSELKQWNELYGEGGSRKKHQLPYFL